MSMMRGTCSQLGGIWACINTMMTSLWSSIIITTSIARLAVPRVSKLNIFPVKNYIPGAKEQINKRKIIGVKNLINKK